jgi:hypothetical protein
MMFPTSRFGLIFRRMLLSTQPGNALGQGAPAIRTAPDPAAEFMMEC